MSDIFSHKFFFETYISPIIYLKNVCQYYEHVLKYLFRYNSRDILLSATIGWLTGLNPPQNQKKKTRFIALL